MLVLQEEDLVGTGTRRKCYRHPDEPGKCVKVSTITKGRDKQSTRETAYYRKYHRRGCSLVHLAAFHGKVETNLGTGWVFDLVTDPDGRISKPLGQSIKDGDLVADYKKELDELRDYMFTNGIVCGDFNHGNLLVQKQEDGSRRLMIIDGLGNSDFIKLGDYWKPHRDRKLTRKWKKLLWRLGTFEEMAREGQAG